MTDAVQVYRVPYEIEFLSELDDSPTGSVHGVEIGVVIGGNEVWSKRVMPIFVSLRGGLLMSIPKPFYARRITRALAKARKIAAGVQ